MFTNVLNASGKSPSRRSKRSQHCSSLRGPFFSHTRSRSQSPHTTTSTTTRTHPSPLIAMADPSASTPGEEIELSGRTKSYAEATDHPDDAPASHAETAAGEVVINVTGKDRKKVRLASPSLLHNMVGMGGDLR